MIVARNIAECREHRARLDGPVALVPTMGALHAGHVSLIDAAKKRAPNVVASIFVNPTQFGPREDFNKYPRPIEDDLRKCEEAGVALAFNPSVEGMYRPNLQPISIELPQLAGVLEGKHRPGHFAGVCQVRAKGLSAVSRDPGDGRCARLADRDRHVPYRPRARRVGHEQPQPVPVE
jgi:pantoate--beta-alanine ligase